MKPNGKRKNKVLKNLTVIQKGKKVPSRQALLFSNLDKALLDAVPGLTHVYAKLKNKNIHKLLYLKLFMQSSSVNRTFIF